MTASHGPARVEERCAHRSRTSTPPVPVDDRGRRRDRGTSFTESIRRLRASSTRYALRGKVKERADDFRASPSTAISVAGLGLRPLADALGIFRFHRMARTAKKSSQKVDAKSVRDSRAKSAPRAGNARKRAGGKQPIDLYYWPTPNG